MILEALMNGKQAIALTFTLSLCIVFVVASLAPSEMVKAKRKSKDDDNQLGIGA